MKALVLEGYGGNDRLSLREMPRPVAGPGQVLIRVSHAGLNPLDFKLRKGQLRLVRKLHFPHIMGNEVAGVVEAVGPGVSDLRAGDEVYARLHKGRMGGFAELVAEDAVNVAPRPRTVSMEVAAGVPLVALTAWQCLVDEGKIDGSSRVLVHSGAGSVGRIAVQLCKLRGAHTTATASARGEALMKGFGVDRLIDYKREAFDEGPRAYDVIFDTVGGDTLARSFKVIAPGGLVISIAGVPEPRTAGDMDLGAPFKVLFFFASFAQWVRARRAGARYRFLFMQPSGARLRELGALIDEGKLVASVDRVFALDDYRQAFEYQESGKAFGKVVFRI